MSRCPTCGRLPQRNVADQVISGEIPAHRAPLIAEAWRHLQAVLPVLGERSAQEVASLVSRNVGCSTATVRNLLSAATRAQYVRTTYRAEDGHRRAYVRWVTS